ncbi:MAG TPA: hypothetical protein H9986_03960 [Candidatus Prevotella stercoripullorum]|nr:hypothetical protein [Candidatus Prevotella stercoripullorum]
MIMEPKIGDMMKADPQLTGPDTWVTGAVIDIEHNPSKGLVVAIKDELGRIFFGQIKYFQTA